MFLAGAVGPADAASIQTTTIEGTWTAQYARAHKSVRESKPDAIDTSRIYVQFSYRDHSNMGHTWPAASLAGLDLQRDADNIAVTLRREAGTLALTGNVRKRRAFGLFDFTPNADYARQIGATPRRNKELTPEKLLAFAIHDVSREFIAQLEKLGYKDLDLDKLLAMRIHGVTPEFITEMRELGLASLSSDDLIAFRIHGVSREFVDKMRAAGYKDLKADNLIAARIHGVSPEFIAELKPLGYSGLDFNDLIAFRIHGVTREFIEEMAAVGYKNLPPERLIEFRIHGVDAEFVNDLKEQGFAVLSSGELVEARIHGRRWIRRRGKG
jgi:hypothetical protein